ncbi:MAG: DUF4316 domain-containing protein [Lachnospiraceae bacterium]|nr:DUF4316 domain-containing protein [Lachnospiraceae bacterium]
MEEIKKWDEINGAVIIEEQKDLAFKINKEKILIENYLKFVEMSIEDDYGMIDGIINNGKKENLQERPSILTQLHKGQDHITSKTTKNMSKEMERSER